MSDGAVFERKEVKYRISAQQLRAVLEALDGRLAPDKYGQVKVESLYLDTPERLLIGRSLEKPLYKEKLRVRGYGGLAVGGPVFVEVKKKFRGIVYKRRVSMSFEAAFAYLSGMPYEAACARYPLPDARAQAAALKPRSLQIAREIDAFVARYQPLEPSMLISCKRVAYAPAAAEVPSDLRITFDTELSYVDSPAWSAAGVERAGGARERQAAHARHAAASAHSTLLQPGEAIMEIKNRGPYPLWLTHALAAADVKPSSFSKYGAAYCASLTKKGDRCA